MTQKLYGVTYPSNQSMMAHDLAEGLPTTNPSLFKIFTDPDGNEFYRPVLDLMSLDDTSTAPDADHNAMIQSSDGTWRRLRKGVYWQETTAGTVNQGWFVSGPLVPANSSVVFTALFRIASTQNLPIVCGQMSTITSTTLGLNDVTYNVISDSITSTSFDVFITNNRSTPANSNFYWTSTQGRLL